MDAAPSLSLSLSCHAAWVLCPLPCFSGMQTLFEWIATWTSLTWKHKQKPAGWNQMTGNWRSYAASISTWWLLYLTIALRGREIDPGNWWEVPWFHDILFVPVRKTPLWSPLDAANWCQVEKVVGASAFHSPLSLWCGQVFWVGELESLVCDLPKRWGFERLRKSHDDAHDPQERKAGMIGVHVCMHTRICIWWAVDLEILVKIYVCPDRSCCVLNPRESYFSSSRTYMFILWKFHES